MKKLAVYAAGMMMALSLAACSPTKVEPTKAQTENQAGEKNGENLSPDGLTPEEARALNQPAVDPKTETPDPNAEVMESVLVYMLNDEGNGLKTEMEDAETVDADTVAALLVEKSILDEGTTVNSCDISGGEKAGPGVDASETGSGERVGTLDLSQLDPYASKAVLCAIGNTFCENFELDSLEILVNGEAYSGENLDGDVLTYVEDYKTVE